MKLARRRLFLGFITSGLVSAGALEGAVPLSSQDLSLRTQASALLQEGFGQDALGILKEVVSREPTFAFDQINLAFALLDQNQNAEVLPVLEKARSLDASYLQIPMMRGVALKRLSRYPEAIAAFQEVLARDKDAVAAHFHIGLIHFWEQRFDQAQVSFEAILKARPALDPAYLLLERKTRFLALKNLSQASAMLDQEEKSNRYMEEAMQLKDQGAEATEKEMDVSRYSSPLTLSDPRVRAELSGREVLPPASAVVKPLQLHERPPPFPVPCTALAVSAYTTDGPASLITASPLTYSERHKAGYTKAPLARAPGMVPETILAADLSGDPGPEWVLLAGGAVSLSRREADGSVTALPLPALPAGVSSAILLDQDHDGDQDLLVGHPKGQVLLQNAGASGFTLRSEAQSGLTTGCPEAPAGFASGDLDEGNDLDLVTFVPGLPPILFLSRRGGAFERRALVGPGATGTGVVGDFDGDGLLDVVYPAANALCVLKGHGDGSFDAPGEIKLPGSRKKVGKEDVLASGDLDLDGREDLLVFTEQEASSWSVTVLLDRVSGFVPMALPGKASRASGTGKPGFLLADLDCDGDLDLFLAPGTYLENQTPGASLTVSLSGASSKVHRDGIGAKIYLRRGASLTRVDLDHPARILGLADSPQADLLKIIWTDGVIQNHFQKDPGNPAIKRTAIPAGTRIRIRQKEGLGGSCPYLYVRTGDRLEFVTDALAGSPLGLPMPFGGYGAADPVELIKIPHIWTGTSVSFRITEEYREVTYLDRARLWVVDHPADLQVYPDERITPPPFSPPKVLALPPPRPFRSVRTGAGADVTELTGVIDNRCAAPPTRETQGVAPEHSFVLDPGSVTPGGTVYLVLHGWIYWTDAGINTRIAQEDPGTLHPPILGVPDGRGGFTDVAVLGFPAGRPKTMVFDLTGMLDPEDPRIRIRSTMRVHWDFLGLSELGSAAAFSRAQDSLVIRRVSPVGAALTWHGFSRLTDPGEGGAWRVDPSDRMSFLEAQWIVPRGRYTGYGPVLPLVFLSDDRFAILGPGDGLDLTFKVGARPGPGRMLSLALELTGYCKDAHPATYLSSRVGPLPRRGELCFSPATRTAAMEPDPPWALTWNTRLISTWADFVRESRSRRAPAPDGSQAPSHP